MIKILYTIKKNDPLDSRYNELFDRFVEKQTLSEAMNFIRTYSSTREVLIGKMLIQEAA